MSQEMMSRAKQQGEVVQDRYLDTVRAGGGCAVVVLTELLVEVKQALVVVGGKLDSEGEVDWEVSAMEGGSEVALTGGGAMVYSEREAD